MNKILCIILLICFYSVFCYADNDIVAVVDKDIITRSDLENRVKAAIATNAQFKDMDKDILKSQVLQSLINEKIFLQESKKIHIEPTEEDIDNAISNIEKSQNIPKGKFFKVMESKNIPKDAIMNQIKTNIIWNKLLVEVIAGNIEVSNEELLGFISHNKGEKVHVDAFIVQSSLDAKNELISLKNKTKNCASLKRAMEGKKNKVDYNHIKKTLSEISDLKIRKIISDLHKDQISSIYEEDGKVSFIVVCSKKYDMDTSEISKFDHMLREKKVLVQAEYYMQNLKKKKFIEIYDLNG
ncbi:MAG: SurA N-terminal domain-containing protein [Alphaproteobacteria bacterium]|nr:SurA N-terminal domain-containing protein [Alphaproteobacteria bacterium]